MMILMPLDEADELLRDLRKENADLKIVLNESNETLRLTVSALDKAASQLQAKEREIEALKRSIRERAKAEGRLK